MIAPGEMTREQLEAEVAALRATIEEIGKEWRELHALLSVVLPITPSRRVNAARLN